MSKEEKATLEEALGETPAQTADENIVDGPVIETQTQPEEVKVDGLKVAAVEKTSITEEPKKAEPENWTYAAYSDEKQKRQNIESELAQIKAQNQALQYQMRQAAQQAPQQAPDYLSSPDEYSQHIVQQAQAPVLNIVQHQALQIAELKHGSDKIQSANEWFTTLPPQQQQALNVASQNSPDPWGLLVQEHTKATIAQELSDPSELEQFRAWKASQSAPHVPQQSAQTPSPAQVQLTPSVTSAPNVGKRGGPTWTGPVSLSDALGER